MASERLYEMAPQEGYESLDFEEKNATKYLATFPYPYMNGYLHLGKYRILCEADQIFVVSDF